MDHLIQAVRAAVDQRNSYAALALALTLPDICASLEAADGKTSGRRYAAWWDTFVGPRYRQLLGPERIERVFLSGDDCYALRCAFLHQGLDDITGQRAQDALDAFRFVQPSDGSEFHRIRADALLNLQVDVFCQEMCRAVEQWLSVASPRAEVGQRLGRLMKIEDPDGNWSSSR